MPPTFRMFSSPQPLPTMLRSNRTVRTILRQCVQVQYQVTPSPKSLTEALPVYNHFSQMGSIVHFWQDKCPVTKVRLDTLKVTFHDAGRDAQANTFKESKGDIYKYGELAPGAKPEDMSKLEQDLANTTAIGDFQFKLQFLTRNQDALTHDRDSVYADQFNIPKMGTERERRLQAEEEARKKLDGFIGLF